MKAGFVALHRTAFDNPLLRDGDRFRAWFWLVSKAVWKPTRFDVGGKIITLDRGQLCVSLRELAEQWGWSKSSVDRFLTRLKTDTMIGTETGTGRLIITICNYSKYQDIEEEAGTEAGTASGTAAGQQRDIKEQGNKGTIEPNGSKNPPNPPPDDLFAADSDGEPAADPAPAEPLHTRQRDWPVIPDWIPVEAWNGFVAMRKRKGSMPTAHAVRLMIGKIDRWRSQGHDPGAVLDQSTMNGWVGLFEVKGGQNGSGQPGADNRDGFERAMDRRIFADRIEEPAGAAGRSDVLPPAGSGDPTLAPARRVR